RSTKIERRQVFECGELLQPGIRHIGLEDVHSERKGKVGNLLQIAVSGRPRQDEHMRNPLSLRVNALPEFTSQCFGGLDRILKLLGRRLDGLRRLRQHDASAEQQRKGSSQGETVRSVQWLVPRS